MPGRGMGMGRHWHKRFSRCGYRFTEPRKAVMDVLQRTNKHLSAEEVYWEVRKIYPHAGLTTVYRTLELLVQMGALNRHDFGDGRARYELIEGPGGKHHHHLVCAECKKVINYSSVLISEQVLLSWH